MPTIPKDETRSSLYDGTQVSKADARMEANGTIDELNCHIGLLITELPKEWHEEFHTIQRHLFAIAAVIAGFSHPRMLPGTDEVAQLRMRITEMEEQTGPFRGFILPGGCRAAAQAHICRAVCRRAERAVVATGCHPELVPYLNRLSGFFFSCAQLLNIINKTDEINL